MRNQSRSRQDRCILIPAAKVNALSPRLLQRTAKCGRGIDGVLHRLQHGVAFRTELCILAIDRAPMFANEAQPDGGEFRSESRAALAQRLILLARAGAEILRIRGAASCALLEH